MRNRSVSWCLWRNIQDRAPLVAYWLSQIWWVGTCPVSLQWCLSKVWSCHKFSYRGGKFVAAALRRVDYEDGTPLKLYWTLYWSSLFGGVANCRSPTPVSFQSRFTHIFWRLSLCLFCLKENNMKLHDCICNASVVSSSSASLTVQLLVFTLVTLLPYFHLQ